MNEEVEIAARQIHEKLVYEFRVEVNKAEKSLARFMKGEIDGVFGLPVKPIFSPEWRKEVESGLELLAKEKAQRAFVDLIVAKANPPKQADLKADEASFWRAVASSCGPLSRPKVDLDPLY